MIRNTISFARPVALSLVLGLTLASGWAEAGAPNSANLEDTRDTDTGAVKSRFGFQCLYSRQIKQMADHCVVAYFDRNGRLMEERLDASNVGDVGYYRVLHERDRSGRYVIQAFFPDGQRKTNRIAVEASDQLLARATLTELKASGFVESWHDNGALSFSGYWMLGQPEGRIVDYHRNGKKWQESYYHEGKLDGRFEQWYESGELEIRSEYVEGALMGKYLTYYPNGRKASESTRYFNRFEGPYRTWYEDGTRSYEAVYQDSELVQERSWFPNGQQSAETHYASRVRQGEAKTWYMSGELKTVETYDKGRRNGPFAKYYESGDKWIAGTYVDGQLDGIKTQWDLYKNQRVEFKYVNGKELGFTVFRPDGTTSEYETP